MSVGHLLAFVDRTKIAGALPVLRRQIAMTDTQAAWVVGTALAVSYGVTILVLAVFGRARRRRTSYRMPAGIALWALASGATGLAQSLPQLIAARLLLGVGQALFIPAALSWIAAGDPKGDRSRGADGSAAGGTTGRAAGLATFTAGSSLGRSSGILAIGLVLGGIGWAGVAGPGAWRWAFAITVLPNLVLLALVARARLWHEEGAAPASGGDHAVPLRAQAVYLPLVVMPVLLAQATIGWLPTLFVLDRDVTASQAATWIGLITVVAGPGGQIAGGWLMHRIDRWHRSIPTVVAGATVAALPPLALVGWSGDPVLATLGVLLLNLALGIAGFGTLFGWQSLMSPAQRLSGNGMFLALVTTVGVGLGPLVAGVLTDRGANLRWALMATGIGCAAGAVIAACLAQPLYRRHRLA